MGKITAGLNSHRQEICIPPLCRCVIFNGTRGRRPADSLLFFALARNMMMNMEELFNLSQPVLSERRSWKLPDPADLLDPLGLTTPQIFAAELGRKTHHIESLLNSANITARVVQTVPGPRLTQFRVEFKAARGRGITNPLRYVQERRQAAFAAFPYLCRVTAPEDGGAQAVFEILNETGLEVRLCQVLFSPLFMRSQAPLKVALGVDPAGRPRVADLAAMPHLLVAGMTGSGKSVFLDGLALSLLLSHTPETLRLIMLTDNPELNIYRGLPHLLAYFDSHEGQSIQTGLQPTWKIHGPQIVPLLHWLENERDRRLELIRAANCADIQAYNRRAVERKGKILPYIVIFHEHFFIYENVSASGSWETNLPPLKAVDPLFARLAQTAHPAGIHLVVCNSIPSSGSMSSALRESFPARACFSMNNPIPSRQALGVTGAEYLTGCGDFLYRADPSAAPVRLHACHTNWDEARRVVNYWMAQAA